MFLTIFHFFSFYGEFKTLVNVVEALKKFEVSIFLLVLANDAERVIYIDFKLARYGDIPRSGEFHCSLFCIPHPDVSYDDD